MRLLNVESFQLESFLGADIDVPSYAILSHTWDSVEITFQDIQTQDHGALRRNSAFAKVENSCQQARRDGFKYVWIDTCCIDKSSSAELSEAINSMFKWYQQSSICYVFLNDFGALLMTTEPSVYGGVEETLDPEDTSFFKCRWFNRGWTLQELIAPRRVDFFDGEWVRFGTRDGGLQDRLCARTGIWPHVFIEERCPCLRPSSSTVRDGVCNTCGSLDTLPQTLDTFAVSIKMSWASSRVTTRKEDAAYCLLGLFNINLPMLYGEGDKAFMRLQDALVRQSRDQSILLWRIAPSAMPRDRAMGCLAPRSVHFRDPVPIIGRRVFGNVEHRFEADFFGNMAPMELSDTALKVNMWLCPCTIQTWDSQNARYLQESLELGILDLALDSDYLVRPAILLEPMGVFDLRRRVQPQIIIYVDPRQSPASFHFTLDGSPYGTADDLDVKDPMVMTSKWNSPSVDDDLHDAVRLHVELAAQNDVSILVQPSPINAVNKLNPSYVGWETGPLYVIINQDQRFPCQTDSGGSHPMFNLYSARTTQISAPWAWKECEHGKDRCIGGLHFLHFTFHIGGKPRRVYVAITWGRQQESLRTPRFWCRIFDMRSFMAAAWTSPQDLSASQLYGEADALPPGQIQRRIDNQRQRLGKPHFKDVVVQQPGGQKRLFPDTFKSGYETDRLLNVLEVDIYVINFAATISRVQGLGRTLFELTVDIQAVEKRLQSKQPSSYMARSNGSSDQINPPSGWTLPRIAATRPPYPVSSVPGMNIPMTQTPTQYSSGQSPPQASPRSSFSRFFRQSQ